MNKQVWCDFERFFFGLRSSRICSNPPNMIALTIYKGPEETGTNYEFVLLRLTLKWPASFILKRPYGCIPNLWRSSTPLGMLRWTTRVVMHPEMSCSTDEIKSLMSLGPSRNFSMIKIYKRWIIKALRSLDSRGKRKAKMTLHYHRLHPPKTLFLTV